MSNSNRDLAAAKEALLKRKRELEEQLTQLSKESLTDGQVQDPGDQALTSTMELLRTSFQEAEIDENKRISRALEKIEDGTYGICVDCNNEISERRLKSYPDAQRCLICQEEYEDMKQFE